MDIARKYRKEFALLESKFAGVCSDWEQHLSWVEACIKNIAKEYPYSLKPDAWATKQAVSAALQRLSAIEGLLIARHGALNARYFRTQRPSLRDIIASATSRSLVGLESRQWRQIQAVEEANAAFKHERKLLRKAERHLSKQIEDTQAVAAVSKAVRSDEFVTACQVERTTALYIVGIWLDMVHFLHHLID